LLLDEGTSLEGISVISCFMHVSRWRYALPDADVRCSLSAADMACASRQTMHCHILIRAFGDIMIIAITYKRFITYYAWRGKSYPHKIGPNCGTKTTKFIRRVRCPRVSEASGFYGSSTYSCVVA